MSTLEHPDDEKLIAFFENPAAREFKNLSLHLAICQNCRNQVSALSKLKETLEEITTTSRMDLADAKIETDNVFTQDSVHSQNLKTTLHFETHRAAMDRALIEEGKTSTKAQEKIAQTIAKKTGFAGVVRRWLRLRTPFWVTVPAAGLAAIVFIFLFSSVFSPDAERLSIAAYQDNAVIQFQSKTSAPGIGFFDKARTSEKPFDHMNITLIKNTGIAFSWPSVENAIDYTLALQIIQQGEKRTVNKITTKETQAIFQKSTLEKNTRYEWILSGQTQDELIFQTSGGFVLTQTRH